jgi:hypothetical protein
MDCASEILLASDMTVASLSLEENFQFNGAYRVCFVVYPTDLRFQVADDHHSQSKSLGEKPNNLFCCWD